MDLIRYFGGHPRWCFASVMQNGKPVTAADVKDGPEGIGPLAGDSIQSMYRMQDGSTAYFGSHKNATGKISRFGLTILGSGGAIEILTGYLPSVQFLDDPSWSPGRSKSQWQPIASAGIGQPEPLKDDSAARGQRRRRKRPDRGHRREPRAEVQHLRSPRGDRDGRGVLRVAPDHRAGEAAAG